MLKLFRMHWLYKDFEDTLECTGYHGVEVLEDWEIGKFNSFEDVEKYLISYHNYEKFGDFDRNKMKMTIDKIGGCCIPVFHSESLNDGSVIRFRVEIDG